MKLILFIYFSAVFFILFAIIRAVLENKGKRYTKRTYTTRTTAEFKGQQGEEFIKDILGETIPGEKYVINNLIIKSRNGSTTQIDHVLINSNAIYVIETKNYSGRIYGNEKQEQWTQVLNYGKSKYRIYNPILQNATHVNVLKRVLNTNLPIKSIIVFVNNNTEYIEANNVYTPGELREEIRKPLGPITVSQMEEIYTKLLKIQNETEVTDEEHAENVKIKNEEREERIRKGICPHCGYKLIWKDGKYGPFQCCSNYPYCKYIKK